MFNITENDYSIMENPNSAFHAVKLKTGTWKGVLVTYGQVGVKESPELDIATLTFNYHVNDPGEFNVDELNEDEAFKNYLGAILQYIITDSLEWGEKNNIARIGIGNNEPTTDTHTEPSSE